MQLDIRLPIGMLFSILGGILVVFGAVSNSDIYHKSMGININLWWGLVMLIFGLLMFFYGLRATRRNAATPDEGNVEGPNAHIKPPHAH